MPLPSKDELDRDMMGWWDALQRDKPPPVERQEIQVDTKHYKFKEDDKPQKGITPPPDKILQ